MAVPCPFSKLHPQQKSWSLATQMRTETRSQFDSLQGRLGALGNQPTRSTIGFVGMSLSIVAGRIPLKASSIPLAIEVFRCRRLDNASRISTTLSQLPSPRALLHSSNNSKRRKEYTARCVTERPRQLIGLIPISKGRAWSNSRPFGPERFTAVPTEIGGCAAQELLRLIGTLV